MSWAEDDWERATPPVTLPADEVAELVGFAPLRIQTLAGGKANTHLRVQGADADQVLRIVQRDAATAEREQRLWPMVRPHVPVPTVHRWSTTRSGLPVAVMDYVAGETPADVMARAPEAAHGVGLALGHTLAGLGAVPVAEMGLFAPDLSLSRRFDTVADSFLDLVDWSLRRGRAGKRLGPAAARVAAAMPRAAEALAVLDDHPGLAHGDYKSSNLLIRPAADRWEVAAVLDWEFACPFTPMLDIAILMRHRDTFPPSFQAGFAAGYGARAWLPDDWRALSRIVDMMNLVGFLNASGDRPRLYEAVTGQLLATADAIRRGSPGGAAP